MPKLLKVDNPDEFRVEGPLLHFDEVVPFGKVVLVIARAYMATLRSKGIY